MTTTKLIFWNGYSITHDLITGTYCINLVAPRLVQYFKSLTLAKAALRRQQEGK